MLTAEEEGLVSRFGGVDAVGGEAPSELIAPIRGNRPATHRNPQVYELQVDDRQNCFGLSKHMQN